MKYDKDIVVKWFAEHGLNAIPEYRFDPERKWRFDFRMHGISFPTYEWHRVALEVEGGVWTQGRHTRGSGFVKDLEKYNRAATLGWRILRVQPKDLCTTETIEMVKEALQLRSILCGLIA